MISLKSKSELEKMRQAGRMVAHSIQYLKEKLSPGITTGQLDDWVEEFISRQGGIPSFKGYQGFPANICVSVNQELVHGIPGHRQLKEGDLVSLDLGVIYKGYQADGAVTVGLGEISDEAERLLQATEGALWAGIAQARAGNRVGDISSAIQKYVEERGFSVVQAYVGHGIGQKMHEPPPVPNYGPPGQGPLLRPGMTLAVEPMVNAGSPRTKVGEDNWTVLTADGRLSAHFEHTVAITEGEPQVLTVKQ